jgi:hypothetical protein
LWYITKIHLWTICRVNASGAKVCFAKNVPVHLMSFEKHLQTPFCGFTLMMSIYYEYYMGHCLLTQGCPIWCFTLGDGGSYKAEPVRKDPLSQTRSF